VPLVTKFSAFAGSDQTHAATSGKNRERVRIAVLDDVVVIGGPSRGEKRGEPVRSVKCSYIAVRLAKKPYYSCWGVKIRSVVSKERG
jgi:hypothetical protein